LIGLSALEISKFVKFLEEYWGYGPLLSAGTAVLHSKPIEAAPAEEAKRK